MPPNQAKEKMKAKTNPADLLIAHDAKKKALPIFVVRLGREKEDMGELPAEARAWLGGTAFKPSAGKVALLPGAGGELAGAVLGLGGESEALRNRMAAGALPGALPEGVYRFPSPLDQPELAAVAWALGAYKFDRYKGSGGGGPRALVLPKGVQRDEVVRIADAVWQGRDLINLPASDLGPSDLAEAAVAIAKAHGAKAAVTSGDDLLARNFPMIHAVGRASSRPPCLVDIAWSRKDARKDAPRITLIGKGICFDTGGLDIKPASAMLLMKKDMGGAAAALALGQMIMGAGLDVRLRILIAAAENSISGNAFRPGDVLPSRAGLSVEIGNTDAEGRLVLADAMALADEDKPDLMMTFATLTGAARVALGPDLPAMFSTDDALAATIQATGLRMADPCWRMPFWGNYERMLDSEVADINHVSDGPFAGAVTAALFLKRFTTRAKRYIHFDMYAWTASTRPGQPKGGETQMARTLYEVIRQEAGRL
jgi:leucyl aminopeptidase